MGLTPEDILAKRFQITKFREGYDQDEVDDYLDEVVIELRKIIAENEELKSRSATGESASGDVAADEMTTFPTAIDPTPAPTAEDTDASRSIIELAQKLHADHVHEGKVKREQLIREAQREATRLVRDAEAQAREILNQMELDRRSVESSIEDLKRFESEYRAKLRDYIQGQLSQILSEEAYADLSGEVDPAEEPEVDIEYYDQAPVVLGADAVEDEAEDEDLEETGLEVSASAELTDEDEEDGEQTR